MLVVVLRSISHLPDLPWLFLSILSELNLRSLVWQTNDHLVRSLPCMPIDFGPRSAYPSSSNVIEILMPLGVCVVCISQSQHVIVNNSFISSPGHAYVSEDFGTICCSLSVTAFPWSTYIKVNI